MQDRLIRLYLIILVVALGLATSAGCEPNKGKQATAASPQQGVSAIDHGGITEIPRDPALAARGEKVFNETGCSACHALDSKRVGPALGDVTTRRSADWLARMIMHPDEMLKTDPEAKKLLAEYKTPMPNQQVTPEQAKAIIAYLAGGAP